MECRRKKTFVGLKNYVNLFKDKGFIDAWWFTIKFTIGNTIIQNVLALLFAVALDSGIRWQKVYRTALFVPCLISAIIVGFYLAENVFQCAAGDQRVAGNEY